MYLGSEGGFRHELRGYLAGFSYVRGSNENAEVLRCLQECAEALKVLLMFILLNHCMSYKLFFILFRSRLRLRWLLVWRWWPTGAGRGWWWTDQQMRGIQNI